MLTAALVGNGPSAHGKGDEIDAHDFVVRMNSFWTHNTDSGRKMSAYAGAARPINDAPSWVLEDLRWEYWVQMPAEHVTWKVGRSAVSMCRVLGDVNGRPLRFFREELVDAAVELLLKVAEPRPEGPYFTCGLSCLFMLLDYPVKFDVIHLYGFDGTNENYRYNTGVKLVRRCHDFSAEKRLIDMLLPGSRMHVPLTPEEGGPADVQTTE